MKNMLVISGKENDHVAGLLMTAHLLISLSVFMFIAAVTPGPNNLLLTASGAQYGFRRTLVLMAGIMLGMQTVLYLSAFGVAAILLIYPKLHTAMKIAGSLYLLWLAKKLATAPYQPIDEPQVSKAVTWYQGALLQFINPKAWLMGLGAVGSYSLSGDAYMLSVGVMSIVMVSVNLVAGFIWIGFGAFIGRFLRSRNAWFTFNIVMGLLTAACVPLIWFE